MSSKGSGAAKQAQIAQLAKAAKVAKVEPGERPGDDLWPALIELTLSQKNWWVAICTELDLSPAQGHAMRALDPDRPVAMSTLADAMVCDASNVTGIVDKLESRGLIARQLAERDRRIKMLVVTERGREVRARLFARVMEPPASIAALPADARRRLAEIIRGVLAERGGAPMLFR
jgi:DNA-binding MarR family transcriptional regulator